MSNMPHSESFSDIVRLLRARAFHQASQLAFSFLDDRSLEGREFTYAELDRQARRVAAKLLAQNLAGERAVLLFQPSAEYLFAMIGCWYAGVTAVPIFAPRMNASFERVRTIVANADARIMLSNSAVIATLNTPEWDDLTSSGLLMIATDTIDDAIADAWEMPHIGEHTLAVLQYTSGSTGTPKGVRLQHKHLMTNSRMIARNMQTDANSIGVIWIPPYHDMGLIGGVLQPLYTGFPVHLMVPASFLQRPMRWLEAMSHYGATHTAAPNFAYDLCVKRAKPEQIAALDLSKLRVMGNGAEPIRAETLTRFADTFAPAGFDQRAFFPCYGMAETTLYVCGNPAMRGIRTLTVSRNTLATGTIVPSVGGELELVSSGIPDPEVSIVVVDPLTNSVCEPGEVGEIWISGATVADGYWNRPDATAETFEAHLPGSPANWLRTGDLGALVEGEVYVTGRIKDLIVIRGHNHYPQDIEATTQQAHEAIKTHGVAAFALDTSEGEGLGLIVELERGKFQEDTRTIEAAIRNVISQEHQLAPTSITFVKTNRIPRTSSGKIQRLLARDMLLDGRFAQFSVDSVEEA